MLNTILQAAQGGLNPQHFKTSHALKLHSQNINSKSTKIKCSTKFDYYLSILYNSFYINCHNYFNCRFHFEQARRFLQWLPPESVIQ